MDHGCRARVSWQRHDRTRSRDQRSAPCYPLVAELTDLFPVLHHLGEIAVHSVVVSQFRVERRGEKMALPRRDNRTIVQTRQHLGLWSHSSNNRGAEEYGAIRAACDALDLQRLREAIDVTTKVVTLYRTIHKYQAR